MADQESITAGETLSRDALAALLNEDLAREYQAIIAYVVYSQVLKGPEFMNIADQLELHAQQELKHALIISRQIDAPEDILPPCPGNVPRRHGVPSPAPLLGPAQLRRNRLIVLEVLPRPLVGIAGHRRRSFATDLATLIRCGIGCPVKFADRLVATVLGCSLRFFAAHSGNRG
jgi:hypothetical protein